MALVARWKGHSLRLDRGGMIAASFIGLFQFCVNFNAVYLAERYITSGLVATVFALLLIPNSLLAWGFLEQKPTKSFFWAALVATAGIGLLFLHEVRAAPLRGTDIAIGLGLTIVGLLGASAANVYQAGKEARRHPLFALLAWSMAIGAVVDALIALCRRRAAGVRPAPGLLAGRGLSRAGRVGAVLQPVFPGGAQDRAGQGGLFERHRADHRHGAVDRVRGLSLDAACRSRARCWRSAGCSWRWPDGGGRSL